LTGSINVNESTREITVDSSGSLIADDGVTTLAEAVAHANGWDGTGSAYTILFDASLDTIWLTTPIVITTSMTIDGGPLDAGSPSVDIRMDTFDRIFEVDLELAESLFLGNVGVKSGNHVSPDNGTGGAGMLIEGSGYVSVFQSEFSFNSQSHLNPAGTFTAGYGGGILHEGGTLVVTDSTFANNKAGFGGGAISSSTTAGQLYISGSTFTNNSASGAGGAIYALNHTSTVTIVNSTFEGNSVADVANTNSTAGGAIYGSDIDLTVSNTTFSDNSVAEGAAGSGDGGAIALVNSTANVQSTQFNRSSSEGVGGAIFGVATDLTVTGSSFLNTEWFGGGNAIELLGDGTLDFTTSSVDLTGTTNPIAIFGPNGRNVIEADPEGTEYRTGDADDDILLLGTGMTLRLGDGADLITGTMATFFGNTVADLSIEDVFWMTDDKAPSDDFRVLAVITPEPGGGISAEYYLDGVTSTFAPIRIVAENDISGTDILISHVADQTQFGLIDLFPALSEGTTVADADPERSAMLEFFAEGWQAYSITTRTDLAATVNNNAIGVYEVSGGGTISNVRILIDDAKVGTTETFQRVTDGYLEFFIIKDGADLAATLGRKSLSIDSDGSLLVNGVESDRFIWHMDTSRNSDAANHAIIGHGGRADTIRIGFEDASAWDNDFQDVVIDVQGLDGLPI
jgi:predicted outer membrane repeat protein